MDFLHRDFHTSPFKALVSTNNSTSELEAKRVQEFLDDHLRELCKQDEEISSVSTLLHRLTNEQLHLQQHTTAHQAIVSSIRRFPTEILAENLWRITTMYLTRSALGVSVMSAAFGEMSHDNLLLSGLRCPLNLSIYTRFYSPSSAIPTFLPSSRMYWP
ncbi:hypothetical protein ARMSODRAFT_676276 [Armillaria solidipes]|uniref:Uncharacterized protein n=1 Tax=Armillaria solidipes TaxID=1076256 RepID=A0A2H3AQ96_9AGAR|nr:hypothetical protein ARMSODRAFT_676276 [Armillaria solidipes]